MRSDHRSSFPFFCTCFALAEREREWMENEKRLNEWNFHEYNEELCLCTRIKTFVMRCCSTTPVIIRWCTYTHVYLYRKLCRKQKSAFARCQPLPPHPNMGPMLCTSPENGSHYSHQLSVCTHNGYAGGKKVKLHSFFSALAFFVVRSRRFGRHFYCAPFGRE